MAFLSTQAKEYRCGVERQVNSVEKGKDAHNPERNRFWEHMPGTENREKRHKLHDNRQYECLADLLRHDLVAAVHGVHAERCPERKGDIQCDGGQKDNRSDNCSDVKHIPKIKKRTPSGKGGNLKESESVWVLLIIDFLQQID